MGVLKEKAERRPACLSRLSVRLSAHSRHLINGQWMKSLGEAYFGVGVTVSSSPLQIAVPNLSEAVQDADLLVFVIPHQFIHRICDEITGRVPKKALGITLIKVTCL